MIAVTVLSFAFPSGIPPESTMVFNARFIKPPMAQEGFDKLTGLDKVVQDFIETDDTFMPFYAGMLVSVGMFIPRYYMRYADKIVISIGCTGGQHRSVYMAEKLGSSLKDLGHAVTIEHREIAKYL